MSKSEVLSEFEGVDTDLARELLDLQQEPSVDLQRRIESIPVDRNRTWMPRWIWRAVILIGLLGLFFGSPAARATWEGVEQIFGQVRILVLDQLPEYGEVDTIEAETVSLEEAQSAVPFAMALPHYLPDGYEMARDLQLYRPEGRGLVVEVEWHNPDNALLELSIHAFDQVSPTKTLVGMHSSQAVLVNGQDAVIVYGGWDVDSREWQAENGAISLIWEYQGTQYNLLAYGDERITSEVLVQIAESID